jgi:hypothetical protein
MLKKLLESYHNFDKITNTILKNGLKFCKILCILSASTLLTYTLLKLSPIVYHIGISLFRLSLIFGIEFIICGFVADGIKKQLI